MDPPAERGVPRRAVDRLGRARGAVRSREVQAWFVRAVLAVAQSAALLYVWPLWQPRDEPPNLELVPGLASVPMGVVLIASAAAFVRFPRAGSAVHAALLTVAMLGDQLRVLPEFVSLAIVMLAVAWGEIGRTVGLAHLASLWLWSGVNKALSPIWPVGSAQFIARSLHLDSARPWVAVVLPVAEVALGLAVLIPWLRRRRVVPFAAALLHLGILGTLVLAWFNLVVWPWNAALAVAAPFLLRRPVPPSASGSGDPAVATEPPRRRPAAVAVWIVFLVLPSGFYFGMVDAYLAHNLYSDNTGAMQWCDASGRCPAPAFARGRAVIKSPYPPERRVFLAWFAARCEPGDTLKIVIPEVRVPRANAGTSTHTCPG